MIMKNKSCLILGAGLMQNPAILSAKQLGYKTFVIDGNPNAICNSVADVFTVIDLKAKEEILSYAKELKAKENLSCIFTAGTDFSTSVSYVCEALKLPSHSYKAAVNASVKTTMRQCFKDNNVPSPEFIKVTKDDLSNELLSKINGIMDYPFVVKPVDNMGARGCRMVRSSDEFNSAIETAIASSKTGTAIVEEYMEGPEYSIDALIYNGTMTITGFAIRHIKYEPYFIEIGHTMPAVLSEKERNELISVFALGAKALGLSCGAAKADIKYTKKGPMIGEIAGRLSGGYMSGWTYPYASDLNLTKQGLLIAGGNVPEELISKRVPITYTPSEICKNNPKPYELYEVPCKRTSAERAWMSIPGKVKYIEDITEFTDRAVFDVLPRATVEIGSEVDFPRNNVEKCGNVICVSHDREMAIKVAEKSVSNIFITLEPNNQKTENYLNHVFLSDEEKFPPSAYKELSDKELETITGKIEKNKSVINFIPEILKSADYVNAEDWNFNTIEETARKFDILRPVHPEIDAKKFWSAVVRGGIQAAVYVSDSVK